MRDERDDNEATFKKRGLKYNGFRIPWPFVAFGIMLVSNAAIIQYKVTGYDAFQHDVQVRLSEIDRKHASTASEQAVVKYRIQNLSDVVNYHRLNEHRSSVRRSNPNDNLEDPGMRNR